MARFKSRPPIAGIIRLRLLLKCILAVYRHNTLPYICKRLAAKTISPFVTFAAHTNIMDFNKFKMNHLIGGFEQLKLGSIEWNDIKRIPQSFKRKTKVGTYTVDEEFDNLHKYLGVLECHLKIVMNYSHSYTEQFKEQLQTSKRIGEDFKTLFDPYNNLNKHVKDQFKTKSVLDINDEVFQSQTEKELFLQDYRSWILAQEYIDAVNEAIKMVGDPSEAAKSIREKCQQCLTIIDSIKERVKTRNHVLDDYDAICCSLDTLCIKENTKELSAKELQTKFNLERKADHLKLQYDVINDLFKKELPYFLGLATSFTQPITLLMFFIQLLNSYQNLLPLQQLLGIEVESIPSDYWDCDLKESQHTIDMVQQELEKLRILRFRDNYYEELTKNQEKDNNITLSGETSENQGYCKALFSFEPEQESDLRLQPGDVIKIVSKEGCWWTGTINSRTGIFPSNYVMEINS